MDLDPVTKTILLGALDRYHERQAFHDERKQIAPDLLIEDVIATPFTIAQPGGVVFDNPGFPLSPTMDRLKPNTRGNISDEPMAVLKVKNHTVKIIGSLLRQGLIKTSARYGYQLSAHGLKIARQFFKENSNAQLHEKQTSPHPGSVQKQAAAAEGEGGT